MKVAVTGATGFLGRYIVNHLTAAGHACRCWQRGSNRDGFASDGGAIEWIDGQLGDAEACRTLVSDCDALVHAALHHPGGGYRGGEGDPLEFVQKNVLGSIQLFEAARAANLNRIIFISTCAVHERILEDRQLDETHPLWPTSHYGAHKAALEKFVHSYGFGRGVPICALRPTGIYGLATPIQASKWYKLVESVVRGEPVTVQRGGKEVHASDVARAVEILLTAPAVSGEAYNCCDMYISEFDVATTAKSISGSEVDIVGEQRRPANQISTGKLQELGMSFGGWPLLEQTVGEMVSAISGES